LPAVIEKPPIKAQRSGFRPAGGPTAPGWYLFYPVFLVFLSSAGFFGLAFFANAVYAYPEWNLWEWAYLSGLCRSIQTWGILRPFLANPLVKVDLSMVTTMVPFLTFLVPAIRMGVARLTGRGIDENFPFWRGYISLYVQLGLLGTIFGFILAFNDSNIDRPEQIIAALGTALWSTLSGIVFAYLFCPYLVERLVFTALLRIRPTGSNGPVQKDVGQAARAMTALAEGAKAAEAALLELKGEISALLEAREILKGASTLREEVGRLKSGLEEAKANHAREIRDCQREHGDLERRHADLEKGLSALQVQIAAKDKVIAELSKSRDLLQRLKGLLGSMPAGE
jgi:hypothetical protein